MAKPPNLKGPAGRGLREVPDTFWKRGKGLHPNLEGTAGRGLREVPDTFGKRGKGLHPHTFSFTKKTARFTKGRFRPYEGQFLGKIDRERSCSEAAGVLRKAEISP